MSDDSASGKKAEEPPAQPPKPSAGDPATSNPAAPSKPSAVLPQIPLFDERFRWVLRLVLFDNLPSAASRLLAAAVKEPGAVAAIDDNFRRALDDPDVLDAAYNMLSKKVQETLQQTDRAKDLNVGRVKGTATLPDVLSTVARGVVYFVKQQGDDDGDEKG